MHRPVDENSAVLVDGLLPWTVESMFQEADADGDGRVADEEARNFFLRSGLTPNELSTIWKVVKPAVGATYIGRGLTLRRFSQALRLIALVQSGSPLTPELATAALTPEGWAAHGMLPLPAPRFDEVPSLIDIPVEKGSSRSDFPPLDILTPTNPADAEDAEADIFNLSALRTPLNNAERLTETSEQNVLTASEPDTDVSVSKGTTTTTTTTTPSPLAYEVRYPPLNPKASARLTALAAGAGSLFAAPAVNGGVLQWAEAEGDLMEPLPPGARMRSSSGKFLKRLDDSLRVTHETSKSVPTEDGDAAPAAEVDVARGKITSCLHFDDAHQLLWVGTKDGWVFGYDLATAGGNQGSNTQLVSPDHHLIHSFQAHRVGSVNSMQFMPSSGELWTGSSRGAVRVWMPLSKASDFKLNMNINQLHSQNQNKFQNGLRSRELRRSAGERAHNGPILAIVRSADGQVVWTASSRSVALWDACTGAFLGALRRENVNQTLNSQKDLHSTGEHIDWQGVGMNAVDPCQQKETTFSITGDLSSSYQGAGTFSGGGSRIYASRGLDVDQSTGAILGRPSPVELDRWIVQQETWAMQSDRGVVEFAERISEGAGKAVKFVGKLGAKLAALGGSSGGSGAGATSSSTTSSLQPQASLTSHQLLDREDSFNSASVLSDNSGMQQPLASSLPFAPSSTSAAMPMSTREMVDEIVTILSTADNVIWIVFQVGLVERYGVAGNFLGSQNITLSKRPPKGRARPRVLSAVSVGPCVWLGCSNGYLFVLSRTDGSVVTSWAGHNAAVISLAPAGTRLYSLGMDGSINGWAADIISAQNWDCYKEIRTEWEAAKGNICAKDSINVLAVTWNCGESKPEPKSSVFRWIHEHAFDKSIALIGLQEVEMGGTSVALAAAKNALSAKMQERGNYNAQFWSNSILSALGGDRHWHQVALRQLSGMLVMAFARNSLRPFIGEQATASVACGMLGVGGNKGAVAIEFTLHRQRIAIICSHFAAHQNAVEARNANYLTIARHLSVVRRPWATTMEEEEVVEKQVVGPVLAAGVTNNMKPGSIDSDDDDDDVVDNGDGDNVPPAEYLDKVPDVVDEQEVGVEGMGNGILSAAALVWLGDFNYRIEGQYEHVKELALRGDLGPLLACDQLRREHAAGRVFRGLKEAPIHFPPTYKFDKGVASPLAYDSSEKRRVPAWCDRIFYRGSFGKSEVQVSALDYGSWGDVYESDHRPVYASLQVCLPVTNAAKKRTLIAKLMSCRKLQQEQDRVHHVHDLTLAPTTVRLHALLMPQQMVVLNNNGPSVVRFFVLRSYDKQANASQGGQFPDSDIEIRPVSGICRPGEDAHIRIHLWPSSVGAYSSGPRQATFTILVTSEYGEGRGREAWSKLEFTAVALSEFAFDDKF